MPSYAKNTALKLEPRVIAQLKELAKVETARYGQPVRWQMLARALLSVGIADAERENRKA